MTEEHPPAAIDGVSRSGIPYRRGGPSIIGGLSVAWDVLPDCPECGKPTGAKCVMDLAGRPHTRITPHPARLPELDVVGDALEGDPDETEDADAPAEPVAESRTDAAEAMEPAETPGPLADLTDEQVAIGPYDDAMLRVLDELWCGANDAAFSRDFRTFRKGQRRVDGGGVLDEDAYIRVKAYRMRRAYAAITAERDDLRRKVDAVRALCEQDDHRLNDTVGAYAIDLAVELRKILDGE